MASTLHYLIAGQWQGVLCLILIILGLLFFTLSRISIHSDHSFSGKEHELSRSMVGIGFFIAGIVGLVVVYFLGTKPITTSEYRILVQEMKEHPSIAPLLKAEVPQGRKLTRIDFFKLQKQFAELKTNYYRNELKQERKAESH